MVSTAIEQPEREAAAPAGVWDRQYRLLTLGLVLTVAAAAFEALAVATTMPATVRDLGGLSLYGWAFSAFMLTNLVGVTVAGGEADRSGPARPFIAGVALFALGLLVAGLAPSMVLVIAGRAIQGFGAGAIGSVAYVAIGRGFPEAAKPRMLALLSTAWVVPGLIGPALAGLIADHLGWRWVFLALAPLAPLAASLALPALRRLDGNGAAPRDWQRIGAAARLTLGVGLAMAGLGVGSALPTAGLCAIGVLLAAPALRRLLPAGTLRAAPGLPAAIATTGLVNLGFFGADAFVPLALTETRGQTATVAGLALTAATVCWTTGAWIQARLAARGGRRALVVTGAALIASGIAGVIGGLFPATPVLLVPAFWGVAGLGMGLAFSTISLLVLEHATPGQEGAASAAMQLTNGLAISIGTGLGGVLVAYASRGNGSPRAGIAIQDLLMIAVLMLAALAATRLPGRRAPEDTDAA
jgi:MFS family permease